MRLLSRNLVPPNGWMYPQGNVLLNMNAFSETVELITQHRRANGIPIGDPAKDLEDFTCRRWPEGCGGNQPALQEMALNFFRVMAAHVQKGGRMVTEAEANRRAAICKACPLNVPVQEARAGCGWCGKMAESAIVALRRKFIGNRKLQTGELQTCGACGCDNTFQVFIPLEALNSAQLNKEALHEKCWKR